MSELKKVSPNAKCSLKVAEHSRGIPTADVPSPTLWPTIISEHVPTTLNYVASAATNQKKWKHTTLRVPNFKLSITTCGLTHAVRMRGLIMLQRIFQFIQDCDPHVSSRSLEIRHCALDKPDLDQIFTEGSSVHVKSLKFIKIIKYNEM